MTVIPIMIVIPMDITGGTVIPIDITGGTNIGIITVGTATIEEVAGD